MTAVRCHAAIVAVADLNDVLISGVHGGEIIRETEALGMAHILPNVIVSYDSPEVPTDGSKTVIVNCRPIVHPFIRECQSTTDYNGVAVIGCERVVFLPLPLAAPYLG